MWVNVWGGAMLVGNCPEGGVGNCWEGGGGKILLVNVRVVGMLGYRTIHPYTDYHKNTRQLLMC